MSTCCKFPADRVSTTINDFASDLDAFHSHIVKTYSSLVNSDEFCRICSQWSDVFTIPETIRRVQRDLMYYRWKSIDDGLTYDRANAVWRDAEIRCREFNNPPKVAET